MKKLSIGQRIAAGFGAVIVITLALALYAYSRIGVIDADSMKIGDHQLPTVYLVGQIQNNAQANVGLVLRHIFSKDVDEMGRIEGELRDRSANNATLLPEYEKLIITDKGRALFEQVKNDRTPLNNARDQCIALSGAGKKADAAAFFQSRMLPLNAKYMESLAAVASFNKASADDAVREVEGSVSAARTAILIGLALALVAALGISVSVVRAITRPLAVALELVERVGGGT